MENKNVFSTLADIYNEQVEESDKEGYAEKLKFCTELFFNDINDSFKSWEEPPVTFEDIEYLDGYFIFGFGTNSVIHFHIKECPGWKFGIWWNIPDGSSPEQKYITGTFFTQYEETLDKFKPSHSEITAEVYAYHNPDVAMEEEAFCSCRDAAMIIEFIKKEPYLAFCRDYCYWNYNLEYHTREEAKTKYDEFRKYKDTKDEYTGILNGKILSFVREKIIPLFKNARIEDRGENWSPRYEVFAPLKDNTDIVSEPGFYSWFDDEEDKELMTEYYALEKACDNMADKYDFLWFSPISDCVYFYSEPQEDSE